MGTSNFQQFIKQTPKAPNIISQQLIPEQFMSPEQVPQNQIPAQGQEDPFSMERYRDVNVPDYPIGFGGGMVETLLNDNEVPEEIRTKNYEIDTTPFSEPISYSYIAIQRIRNIVNTPPIESTVTITGGGVDMFLQDDLLKLNAVDTAPQTCDATYLGVIYFDISEDQMCVCTSGGWMEMDSHTIPCI